MKKVRVDKLCAWDWLEVVNDDGSHDVVLLLNNYTRNNFMWVLGTEARILKPDFSSGAGPVRRTEWNQVVRILGKCQPPELPFYSQ